MEQTNATIGSDLEPAAEALRQRGCPSRIFARTESTNDDARSWAIDGAPHGAVVLADTQSRGRGRMGRSWSCPSGTTLSLSMVLRPAVGPGELSKLALVVGLATRRVLASRLPGPLQAGLKWPNDIVVFDATSDDRPYRKVAGILLEGALSGTTVAYVVAGVGVNVQRESFPPELEGIATSLSRCGATALDRAMLAADLAAAVLEQVADYVAQPGVVAERFASHDVLRGGRLRLEDGTVGIGDGLDPDGRLRIVRDDQSVLLARAGEVTPLEARVVAPWRPA